MLRVILVILLALPVMAGAATLQKEDLVGTWAPSGETPRTEGVAEYAFTVQPDMSATYEGVSNGPSLECKYKPSNSQQSIFVWYCYLKEKHLITLSLGGWRSESGALLYGYEYWLGHPEPGQIHGGLPVSLKPANL
jgi:hypothetical protein